MKLAPLQTERSLAFDGLVTFYASLHAMRAENLLNQAGLECQLIPGPRAISPHCGVALQCWYADAARVGELLAAKHVQVEQVHAFRLSELGVLLAAQATQVLSQPEERSTADRANEEVEGCTVMSTR